MREILASADTAVCDRHAEENGVASQRLMDKAGREVAAAIRARWSVRPALVLAGPGKNGGDGFIAAAALREAGWPVRVALLGELSSLTGDARWAREVWGGQVDVWREAPLDASALARPELVIDALFGAGLSRPLSGVAAEACTHVMDLACPVVAIDLPSGVPGDARPLAGPSFRADLTVTFHRKKLAHLIDPYAETCGEIVLADIGIPPGWAARVTPLARETEAPDWAPAGPGHDPLAHKHRRGRVAVYSGGPSASGAARLAARAALRAGSGLVTLCSPPAALQVNAGHLQAIMLTRWEGGKDTAQCLDSLRADAAVLGPAMGVGEATRDAVLSALSTGAPLVLDADALTSFETQPEALLEALHPACVLTPHFGEFARLFGTGDAAWSRLDLIRAAADRAGCTVLLKGPATLIAASGETVRINRHASAWLATAGSGDVLAGTIAAGLAAGMAPVDAAAGAAWLHGECGRRLGSGLIAEDLPDQLPQALQAALAIRRREAALSHLLPHGS